MIHATITLRITGCDSRANLALITAAAAGDIGAMKLLGMAIKYPAWVLEVQACEVDAPAKPSRPPRKKQSASPNISV